MNSFEKELNSNVVDFSRKDAIIALGEEYVFSGYYCNESEIAEVAKKMGLEDELLPSVIVKLNVIAMSARSGNPDAVKKAESLKKMMPELDGLVDRIIEDANQQAKDFGYKDATGFINVGDSIEKIESEKEQETEEPTV